MFAYSLVPLLFTYLSVCPVDGGDVLATIKCQSTWYCWYQRCGFTSAPCLVAGVTKDTPVTVTVREDRYPYRCSQNGAYYVGAYPQTRALYVVALKGCNGVFEIRRRAPEPKPVPRLPQCGMDNPPPATRFRIVGGVQARNECRFPWMVLVYNALTDQLCGGTILDQTHVMTAAHCLVPPATNSPPYAAHDFYIYSGTNRIPTKTLNISGLKERYIKEIHIHEGYNGKTLANDVAIVKLFSKIKFDKCHRPVCLVDGTQRVRDASNCTVMGWGHSSNDAGSEVEEYLRWAKQQPASDETCAGEFKARFNEKVFCARGNDGSDACKGDSGGPFVCQEQDGKYFQYGVVSAGLVGHECGQGHGLYTKVNSYLDWILDVLTSD